MDLKTLAIAGLVAASAAAGTMSEKPPAEPQARPQAKKPGPPPAKKKFLHAAHLGRKIACLTCHADVPNSNAPAAALAVKPETCARCHPAPALEKHSPQKRVPIVFPHKVHARRVRSCDKCHPGGKRAEMRPCLVCHQASKKSAVCLPCHPDGTRNRPSSHSSTWAKVHGKGPTADIAGCRDCHRKDACDACHRKLKYKDVHLPGFQDAHGPAAKTGGSNCYVCHAKAAFCEPCHSPDKAP